MKIFCIGLSRTGTTSVCEALNLIGINCIHYPLPLLRDHLARDKQKKINELTWIKRRRLLKELKYLKNGEYILSNYSAFVDLPIPIMYKDLDKQFPESKFIYTRRNIENWLKSVRWLLTEGKYIWNWGITEEYLLLAAYGVKIYDEKKLKEAYQKHEEDVLSYFKNRPKDLLILDFDKSKIEFKDLCEFLNKEIPPFDFPKSNKSQKASFRQKLRYKLKNNFLMNHIHFFLKKLKRKIA